MENMFSISFRKRHDGKEENNLFTLIIKIEVLFARAIITSTACASSVSVETCFLTNQRAHVLTIHNTVLSNCWLSRVSWNRKIVPRNRKATSQVKTTVVV